VLAFQRRRRRRRSRRRTKREMKCHLSCELTKAAACRAIWRPRDRFGDIAAVARSTAADVVAAGYKSTRLNLGTVKDPVTAKEEAAAKYNLMASR